MKARTSDRHMAQYDHLSTKSTVLVFGSMDGLIGRAVSQLADQQAAQKFS